MTRALEPKELLCWWWGLGLGFLWVNSDGAGLQPSGPARSHPWAPLGVLVQSHVPCSWRVQVLLVRA